MWNFWRDLRLSIKVSLLGIGSVLITATAFGALVLWQSGQYNRLAQSEVNELIDADLNHITQGVYNLVQAENEAVQQQVDYDLAVARHLLASAGEVGLSTDTVTWQIVSQFGGRPTRIQLPKMLIGDRWLGQNADPFVETPVVDEVTRLVGETATLFQRLNEKGDMLRVATTIETVEGRRAIGTYIPAVDPDGTANPVIAAVLRGETYHGRAFVVDQWYLTAYEPIKDAGGALLGMLYVGIQLKSVEARIRHAVLQTRVGKTGYVYVLAGKGEDRGRYIISQNGERDGENIWESRDSDGGAMIQTIINTATALQPGALATERYRWQNPGEPAPRWKIARLAYYAPWDWVIGTSTYEDELQSYRAVLDVGRNRMTRMLGIAGAAIALCVGLIGIFVAWTIARPVRQMTAAVETIMRGDLGQTVNVHSRDEIGALAHAFNLMTDRLKQTLEGLRTSEETYRRIFENALEGLFQVSIEGRFLSANPAMARLLGYDSPADLIASVTDLRQQVYVHPEDRDAILSSLFERGAIHGFECQVYRKDRSTIWVSLSSRLLRDDAGAPLFIQGFLAEITEHKRAEAERAKLEERLRQSQKMESVGLLAGGVAHDFNNLLTPILGYADLLLARLAATDPRTQPLRQILQAAERAKELVHQLLAFSRKQMIELKTVDLGALIRRCEPMLRRTIRENVRVEIHLPPALGPVRADAGQIEQVLINLAINAQDAMPDGGMLTIEAADTELDAAYTARHPELAPGPYVLLAVSDTGVGMDARTLEHIFEPFFTTKEMGKGTGLGLATAYGIVRQHGGTISASSEPQRGSSFKILLPRGSEPGAPPPPAPSPALARNAETVLVVEDNDMVRALAGQMLDSLGYRVVAAEGVDRCLEMVRTHADPIDLLLTDVVMPKLNGRELFERLRELRPHLKVLFMSGYTGNVVGHHGVLDVGTQFIQKPFSLQALAEKVRQALEA